ncbi:MarR family winged helix-turn-helix transcriptional regulator [Streptomyces sp. NPDC005438]|uniref:MarR family winged helix-turn-helix transcriptional regulator n=1 Tax=Streptomyces sp. NPDC005438 TaxID=3156880 RepID=UPI0033A633E3
MEPEPKAPEELVELALTGLWRARKRHALARLSERRGERTGPHATLPDAVFELLDVVEAADTAPTVTEVAGELAVDQPRASRLVAQALNAGLLRREADQRDGRRSLLTLTEDGVDVLATVRGFRRRVISEATAGWPSPDREALAELLTRFVRDYARVTALREHR